MAKFKIEENSRQTFVTINTTKYRLTEFEGGLEVMLYSTRSGEIAMLVEPRVNNVVVIRSKKS